jgi:hypothetical protein
MHSDTPEFKVGSNHVHPSLLFVEPALSRVSQDASSLPAILCPKKSSYFTSDSVFSCSLAEPPRDFLAAGSTWRPLGSPCRPGLQRREGIKELQATLGKLTASDDGGFRAFPALPRGAPRGALK